MKKYSKTNGAQAKAELSEAGIGVSELVDFISEMNSGELKDFLCDVAGVSHHAGKEEVLRLLGEKF
jgi:hypothetical protein